jgi:hypothetical protein
LRNAYPGSLPWWSTHPSTVALLMIATVTTVILVVERIVS